jgi:hypothetical protein
VQASLKILRQRQKKKEKSFLDVRASVSRVPGYSGRVETLGQVTLNTLGDFVVVANLVAGKGGCDSGKENNEGRE